LVAASFVVSDKHARIQALSEWLMEFSVLWAVFPLLDVLVENRAIQPRTILIGVTFSVVGMSGGILLRRGEPK
jgi:hypothetical protein